MKDLDSINGQAKVLNWFMNQIRKTFITSDGVRVVLAHVNDISHDLGAPIVSVRRWVSFLIKKGYISRRKGPKGKILCNVYIVNPEYIIKGKLTSSEAYLQTGGKK